MNEFARGARVSGGARDGDGVHVDTTALAEAGVLFQSKQHDGDDFLGRAVIDDQTYNIRAQWRAGRDGRRFLRLRFTRLRSS